jgi:hypothetical protein
MKKNNLVAKTDPGRGAAAQFVVAALASACALSLISMSAVAGPPAPFSAWVAIADGGPYTIIRGDEVLAGGKGVMLRAGDMIETGPNALLVAEARDGGVLGLGPASHCYVLPRGVGVTLILTTGWLKLDAHDARLDLASTRLSVQGARAVVVLHAGEHADEVFDEQGQVQWVARERSGALNGRSTLSSLHFLMLADGGQGVTQSGPKEEFVDAMPVPFRDALPVIAQAGTVAPVVQRPVDFSDVQRWLSLPREWRAGFIERFRPRLKDPAFFSAIDAHLAEWPEWREILYPEPPQEGQH